MRRALCPHCKGRLAPPERIHEACIAPWADAQAQKAERRAAKASKAAQVEEKRQDRVKRESLKKISVLEEECRKIVQHIARIRDRNDECISCELPANWDGQWHGSHFRSHGACSALQFNLWNIHKSCWICNKLYSGRIDQYEVKLVQKVGQERVDWLKAQNAVTRNSRDYLGRFKKIMGKRLRRLERSAKLT
jgi:hypothetical protein